MTDFSLTMVSHACIRIDAGDISLLCDPWFTNEPVYNFTTWKFPAATISPEEVVQGLTHVFISHTHEDHFHIPSIDMLPRDVTFILPDYTWHQSARAKSMERTLRALGFEKIVKMPPWEKLTLSPDLTVMPVPAAPSKPHDWENSGLVIEHPDTVILNMNDTPSDEEIYGQLIKQYPHFDILLIQYAGVSIFPGRFRFSEEEMRKVVKNKQANFAEQDRAARMLSFDYLVPFAGDFCWLDDRLYHCNWASRATPALLENWLNNNYPEHDGKFMVMLPSDQWNPKQGFTNNHPSVDWDNYLDEIAILKERFQPKIDAVNDWLASSNVSDIRARTRAYFDRLANNSRNYGIDFTAAFRVFIEGPNANFSFVIGGDPDRGFWVEWDDGLETDQTFYVPETYWASLLEAKIMFCLLPWAGEVDQHVPFRLDLAKFWWWLEYYSDFLNRNPQVVLETIQHPWLNEPIRPQLGVFNP